MKIKQIPVLNDNYIYVIYDLPCNSVVAIDPAKDDETNNFLKENNLKLTHILNTHHHFDHVGGNLKLFEKFNCKIIGYENDADRIPGINWRVKDGETIDISEFLSFKIMFLPGHTNGHIAFFEPKSSSLFSGDVLFSMGCGRLFEGTAEEMFNSLQKIKKLPDETMIYATHEYSMKNTEFALTINSNEELLQFYANIKKIRQSNKPTIPTMLTDEKKLNPFLLAKSSQEFAQIRKMRDVF